MIRAIRWLACSGAFALATAGASAQNAPPSDAGYVGRGDVVGQSTVAGSPITLGGTIALEERGSRVRVDILSFGIPGADPTLSALATQMLPHGGFTFVYDSRDSTYTVWSAAKHAYFVGGGHASEGAPATPKPLPSANPSGLDFFGSFAPLRSLSNDKTFSASLALTGHSTLFGHPVTNVHYQFTQTPLTGDSSFDVHGEIALADDLSAVPIQLAVSINAKSIPQSSLRLDLTQLTKATPAFEDFLPPRGYAHANSLADVLGGSIHF